MTAKTTAQNFRTERFRISYIISKRNTQQLTENRHTGEFKNKWNVLTNKNNMLDLDNPVNTENPDYY